MRRVRIGYVLSLYFLILLLKMVIDRIFEGSWNFIDSAIYSGLWTITFLGVALGYRKISARHREPYIIGNSTEIEYLTPEELGGDLKRRKMER